MFFSLSLHPHVFSPISHHSCHTLKVTVLPLCGIELACKRKPHFTLILLGVCAVSYLLSTKNLQHEEVVVKKAKSHQGARYGKHNAQQDGEVLGLLFALSILSSSTCCAGFICHTWAVCPATGGKETKQTELAGKKHKRNQNDCPIAQD
jgi:Na+-transporting NADH:ubiquinone oxidoreductase subunit NqrF